MISRGNHWVPVNVPKEWTVPVNIQNENAVLTAEERPDAWPPVSMPAVLKAYAQRPLQGTTTIPREGANTRVEVKQVDMHST